MVRFTDGERCIHHVSLNDRCERCIADLFSDALRELDPARAGWRGFDTAPLTPQVLGLNITHWLRDRYKRSGEPVYKDYSTGQMFGAPVHVDFETRDALREIRDRDAHNVNVDESFWLEKLRTAKVEAQSPPAGTTVQVPDVVGLTVSEADATLRFVGLKPDAQNKWERKYHDLRRGYDHLVKRSQTQSNRLEIERRTSRELRRQLKRTEATFLRLREENGMLRLERDLRRDALKR